MSGQDINDFGVVVGMYYGVGYSTAVVYTPWSDYSGYDLGMPVDMRASINNFGEIIGRQGTYIAPAGGPNNYTYASMQYTQFESRWFYGINNLGQIAGSREKIGKGRGALPGGPIRRNADGTEDLLMDGNLTTVGWDLNDVGDVAFNMAAGGQGHVYTDAHGALLLRNLLVGDSVASPDGIMAIGVNMPDAETGFGQILCYNSSTYRSFILTPEVPPSN
jgi:hypothetical protein